MQKTAASDTQRTNVKGGAMIAPCLWFDGQAEEAAKFYVSLFPDSHIDKVVKAPADFPSGKKGNVLAVDFTLMGRKFSGLNGGPYFKFNEAVSFTIPCENQAEVDRYWKALSAVPEAEQWGWGEGPHRPSVPIWADDVFPLPGHPEPPQAQPPAG